MNTEHSPIHAIEPAPEGHELVVILGAKGGCGASLVAANLAATSAATRSTCLVDLDLGKGDVATYLDLDPGVALDTIASRFDDLDETLLEQALQTHASGLRVLPQPDGLEQLRQLGAPSVRRLLSVARAMHRTTFVDAGARVDVASLAAAMIADVVVVIATPDVPALRDARRVLTLLDRLQVPRDRVRLVLNKVPARVGAVLDEVVASLPVPVLARLSRDDAACGRADTDGRLLSAGSPGAAITRELRQLVANLRADGDVPARTRRFDLTWAPAALALVSALATWRAR